MFVLQKNEHFQTEEGMQLNERQNQILTILEEKERASVAYLAKHLYVSEMTVRRDLSAMERGGYLRRYHGGAMMTGEYTEIPIALRMHINEKEKRRMASAVLRHIADGQIIFMTSSSTCAHVIPYLKEYSNLRVVTNSIQFLFMLTKQGTPCSLTGGDYLDSERALFGRGAEEFFRGINPDLAILSCDGIGEDGTVTVDSPESAALDRIAVKNAKKVVLLADKTKRGNTFRYNICHETDVDELIVF